MRRSLTLAAIFFVLVLIMRLPARWIAPLIPHSVHCQQLDGSAWNGTCSGLVVGAGTMGDLSWDLHALQLLRGRLELALDLTDAGSHLQGVLARGFGGALHGRALTFDMPLTNALVSSIPAGAHARLSGKLARFEWTGKYVSEIEGEVDVRDFVGAQGDVFGSYQVVFAPGAAASGDTPTGVVHDLGGPLALDATLQLTHDPGYVLQGQIAARPTAAPDIADQLKYLGSPDASGRRPLSISGTF